jgi:Fe-Mn family superoxide dismutase
MAITLPELPFKRDALAPHISERTIDFHHGKHHKSYVDKTNKMIEGTDLEGQDLESIIASTAKDVSKIGIFNNAAQAWNHAFYWNCLTPGGGGPPSGVAGEKINSDFGSYEAFVEQFNDAATTLFGSGWAWLAMKEGKLDIMKGPNRTGGLIM